METTIVYWDNIGIMEEKMETTLVFCPSVQDNLKAGEIGLWMGTCGVGTAEGVSTLFRGF